MSTPQSGESSGGVPTGHPQVDEALAGLAAVADAVPADQVAALTQAQRILRETLDTIEEA